MEKYIIIFVILATIYYIQTQLKNTEGFADVPTQGLGGVDDTNAINTLAQIAKNLMAGSLTIPGSLTLKGDLVFPDANIIKAAGRLHISPGEILYLLPKTNVTIGKELGGSGDLVVQGNQTVGGNIGITGNQTVGGNISITGNEDIKGNMTITGVTSCTSLKIGGATLTWDADKGMLVLDKGLIVNNGLKEGVTTPGIVTNNVIIGPSGCTLTGNPNQQGSLEYVLTTPLKTSWIPVGLSLLGPNRKDGWWFQKWWAFKSYGGEGVVPLYNDDKWFGVWSK